MTPAGGKPYVSETIAADDGGIGLLHQSFKLKIQIARMRLIRVPASACASASAAMPGPVNPIYALAPVHAVSSAGGLSSSDFP